MISKYRKNDKLFRPRIHWIKVIRNIAVSLAFSACASIVAYEVLKKINILDQINVSLKPIAYFYFLPGEDVRYKLFAFFVTMILLLKLKNILIFAVHVYQCYAPDDIRLACRFTPSCSEYMILSLEKYGVWRGVYKGLQRLGRCHAPNGGEDYP